MSSSEILLEVRHLSKKFADSEPLKDVNCSVRRGEVISIIGPSGTGKSTFLRCINRLEKPRRANFFSRRRNYGRARQNPSPAPKNRHGFSIVQSLFKHERFGKYNNRADVAEKI